MTLLSAAAAVAQEPADTTVVRLDSIQVEVVRGMRPLDRIAYPISIVKPGLRLAARPAIGLEEALATVPGVYVANRYNFALGSRISVRGFGARSAFGVRGVRVLLDGIPLTMPDGQSALNNLELASAERIEVIRGAASALHGNAAGGVIAIESRAPPRDGTSGHARALTGDFGTESLGTLRKLEAGVATGGSRAGAAIDVSRLDLDGWRQHSAVEQTIVNGRGRFSFPSVGELRLVLNAAYTPIAQNPGSLPIDSALASPQRAWPANVRTRSGEAADQVQGGVTLTRSVGPARLDVSLHGLRRELENPLPFAYIDLERNGGGARALLRTPTIIADKELFTTIGFDAEAQRDFRREFANEAGRPGTDARKIQVDRVRALAPFAQAQLVISERLELTAGARYDRVRFATDDRLLDDGDASGERTLAAFSPTVGVVYAPRASWSTYANIASSFQTPTTTELINSPPAPGAPCCPAGFNRELEPQRARSFEVGVRGGHERVRWDAAMYRILVRDELVPFQVAEAPGREFFANVGRSRHQGLELSAHTRPVRWVDAAIAYTYNDLEVLEGRGKAEAGDLLPGVPTHRGALEIGFHAPAGVTIQTDAVYTGALYADDANTVRDDASTVVGFRLSRGIRLGSTTIGAHAGVTNLFDTRYNGSVIVNAFGGRYFEPAPGRALHIGLSAAFREAR